MSLIKRALQKYPVPETLTSKPGERNLIELLSRFPNKGVGMKVYRKTWPENCYWHIYYNKLTSEKSGKVFGIKYWNDEMQDFFTWRCSDSFRMEGYDDDRIVAMYLIREKWIWYEPIGYVGYGNSTNIIQFFKSIFPKDANVIMRFVVIL